MSSRKEVVVIGLGKFGSRLARALMDLGHVVVGVDGDGEKVRWAQDELTQVFVADAMDKSALEQLALADYEHVVVSVGDSMEASILITLHLKEMEAKDVWVKAMSGEHEKVLLKLGVDHVIFPERVAAEQMARKLSSPGLIDYLPMVEGMVIQELTVDNWAGKSLIDLDLTKQFGIQVVALRKPGQDAYEFVPQAKRRLEEYDVLVVIGQEETISELKP